MQAEFSHLAQVSTHLSKEDAARLWQWTAGLILCMEGSSLSFVQTHSQDPILVSFSSDPSSLLLPVSTTSAVAGQTFKRSGHDLIELLLQRLVFKWLDDNGQCHLHIQLGLPIPLQHGKAAANLFRAATSMCKLPRRAGHSKIIIHHLCCDRAVHTALESLLWGRLEAYYKSEVATELGDSLELCHLQELFVSTPCTAHAAQNALKWAIAPLLKKDTLHDLHICIEACRNSFAMLHAHLFDFLQQHVTFRAHAHDLQEAATLWAAVGVDASMLEVVAEVHPIWSGTTLLVAANLQHQTDFLEKVSRVLLYLWRWRRFTESRFASLGAASRALVASLLAGLQPLVAITRQDPHCSDYHLHGFQRLAGDALQCAVVLALSAWVSESFIHSVMDDDRVARHGEAYWACCVEELDYLLKLPQAVWGYLAQVFQPEAVSTTQLRDATITSALISLCYLHFHVFVQLQRLPWSLTLGEPMDQLAALKALPLESVHDCCSVRMRALLDLGYSRSELCRALQLLREASWTTIGVEQQHGSCAVMHKKHPSYELETLAQRAYLHAHRALLSETPLSQRQRQLLQKAQADGPKADRLTGRHVFIQDLFAQTQSIRAESGQAAMPQHSRQQIMAQSGRLYQLLSPQEKAAYEDRALRQVRERASAPAPRV